MDVTDGMPLFINFNQDRSLVAIGTARGYMIYQCEPLTLMYSKPDCSCSIVEMLFRSSLVALVGMCDRPSNSMRKVQIWNTKTDKRLQEINYDTAVLALKMNMKRLVVVLETKMHIHDLQSLKTLMVVQTEPNPRGLCALTPNNECWDHCYLAYPNSATEGEVTVYDALGLQIQRMLPAHNGVLANMAFNMDGTVLATCSRQGTLIRVFQTPEGDLLYSFRRGSYATEIHALCFSLNTEFLCASSGSGTVHVFKLDNESRMEQRNNSSSMIGGMMSSVIPDSLNSVMDPRSFAQVKLADSELPNLCAMSGDNSQVIVVTANGYFYEYALTAEGGECQLVKESKLS